MAEDKKIRISVDHSELDRLRREVRELTFEFNRLQKSTGDVTADQFKAYSDKFVDLQEQMFKYVSGNDNQFRAFDRAFDRFSAAYWTANPNWRSGLTQPPTPMSDRVADTGANRTVWDRIVGYLARITGNMEQEQRDRKNGDVPVGDTPSNKPQEIPVPQPPQQQPPISDGGRADWSERLKDFRLPTSISGLLGMFAGGLIIDQIGQLVGEQMRFAATQANMPDEFQREINRGNNPLLNKFTFGIPGALAQERMHNYQMARQFDRSAVGFAQAFGQSYDSSVGAMFTLSGQLGPGISFEKDIYRGGSTTPEAQRKRAEQVNAAGGIFSPTTGAGISPVAGADYAEDGVFGSNATTFGEDGRSNWASRTLGLDISEYQEKYTQFARAGVGNRANRLGFGGGATGYDMNRLMVAQRYRGLSDSDIENIQRAARYSTNRSGVESMAALDTQLQRYALNNLGYNSFHAQLYASTMLPEMIQRFSNLSNTALQTQGTFDAASTLRQMSSIQNATGAQGQRLERYQNAFMGMGIAQDDVSQALLIRAARGMNPNASYSDIMEQVEAVRSGQNPKVAKRFLEQIEKATGGKGEQFRNMLKTVFPNLSWADVNAYEEGGIDADTLFGSGSSTGSMYSDQQARQTVSATERSGAETRNAQAEKGYGDIYSKMGQNLKDVIDQSQVAKDVRAIADAVAGEMVNQLFEHVENRIDEAIDKMESNMGQYKVGVMPIGGEQTSVVVTQE